ncbi:MAG: glycoside hydrolase family 127 protein [Chloroflexi bacterium]|nr:glycoside hydrolase family 127 protein [Chloroflexota bacterium]
MVKKGDQRLGALAEQGAERMHDEHTSACRGLETTSHDDTKVLYFGNWEGATDQVGQARHRSNTPYSACVLACRGSTVRWLGSQGPDHGIAEVYVDGVLERTVDAYAPSALASQMLFEKTGLDTGRTHTLRIVIKRERNQAATDCFQGIDGFESEQPVDYPAILRLAAEAELRAITRETKAYLAPEAWRPVAYAASALASGVVLGPGLLRGCFERNIAYLNRCFGEPYYSDAGDNKWVQTLPASAEGRMLAGAGHTLRWGEQPDMRVIVDTFVNTVKARQSADGYCLPYDETNMKPQESDWQDERRNYDRVGLTRGLLAAGMAGNTNAYDVLRRFYDWLNASPYYPRLLSGNFYGSAHNCNNGHAGGLEMFFSPVGKAEDLVAVERYFVQDFFIDQARNAEPLSLGYYPLHTPHSYVLLAFEAWLDHYRATGATKYLEAAKGAWRIVADFYKHVGGTIAICEMGPGAYPPGSYYLGKHTGETCGSVFWADFNHRFLQLYPSEECYAAKIEKVILNVILAAQAEDGSIRYHNHLHGAKDKPQCANTCCEVMGVPFIARLPQYIYSVAEDGLYVNLYAPSAITWQHSGREVSLKTATGFPFKPGVTLTLATAAPTRLRVRIRVPAWSGARVQVVVNDTFIAEGQPGTYVTLDREWEDGDQISFALPAQFRLTRYTGFDQVKGWDRYALEYGPLLMALVGPGDDRYHQSNGQPCARLSIAPEDLIAALLPLEDKPLHFGIEGHAGHVYVPYYEVNGETFTCFPIVGE